MDVLLPDITNPQGYFFWLIVVSILLVVLERIWPWRKDQRLARPQIWQDLFWLIFNGHYAGVLLALGVSRVLAWANPTYEQIEAVKLIASQPLWAQFLGFFVLKDLLEWGVHNLLHRVPWLWEFHKLHHSIERLDWIGNFRFHWMEILVYRGLTYVPLALLGADALVLLPIAVVSTLIGHFNHSNLRISWGPMRYVFNSPRMHVWHHDRDWPPEHPRGVNFGICLSLWDWVFRTAWWPSERECPGQQPERLGFRGMDEYPSALRDRLVYPVSRIWTRRALGSGAKHVGEVPIAGRKPGA